MASTLFHGVSGIIASTGWRINLFVEPSISIAAFT